MTELEVALYFYDTWSYLNWVFEITTLACRVPKPLVVAGFLDTCSRSVSGFMFIVCVRRRFGALNL